MTPRAGDVATGAGRAWLPPAAVGVTLLLWSSAFVAIRHLGHAFSPGALSLGRLLVGAVALGAVLAARRSGLPARRDWPALVVIGLLWFGLYNVALNAGERRVDAGTAAMLIQLSPVLVAVLAAVFLRERATPALGVGLLVSFGGVAVIALSTSPSGRYDPIGVLLCLVSAAAYAVSLIIQKPLVGRLSALQVTWAACTVGAVACLPFAGQLVQDTREAPPGDLAWIVYLGVFPTAIAFTTYAFALSHMPTGRLAVTTYLVPPVTVLLGWVLLGETPPGMAYLGGALCLLGVALARRRPRPRVRDAEATERALT
ncbi:MAG TPA: DMT family transporter [Nocardioidaceae bacterium]|jgi:drug/metabolite transporter (DMT)-like permease